ncbi:hypothetical protein HUN92_13815 [Bacillus firmus]|uniref:hypothetical protein n=1 Tax=Cytobacillus firmus TaxID=1399 RepID=UPI001580F549|nr:hypothetical protein [Cytobacillus firmus]NUH84797.1 hypothetical protein [Cytobacillus firmus]
MCQCEERMQYALMEIAKDRMILIDALEYELMEELRESGDIQEANLKLDKEKQKYDEDYPLKVVSGVIKVNPDAKGNIKQHITENCKNKMYTTYLEDRRFHELGLVDIVFHSEDVEDDISFSALICSDINVESENERAITAFVAYADLSSFENILNRDFVLSIEKQSENTSNITEQNWKEYI